MYIALCYASNAIVLIFGHIYRGNNQDQQWGGDFPTHHHGMFLLKKTPQKRGRIASKLEIKFIFHSRPDYHDHNRKSDGIQGNSFHQSQS